MEKPDIGTLRHRLIVERSELGPADGAGGQGLNWVLQDEVWAAVEPVTSRFGLHADRLRQETSHRVWLRFRSNITAGMRLRFGERILAITGVLNFEERGKFLLLACKEET